MQQKISREYSWDMAHRLSKHEGKCWNLHGHTYKCEIELTGCIKSNGMVMDFYELDQIVKPIIEELDHSTMVWMEDEFLRVAMNSDLVFGGKRKMKVYFTNFESTAENIAKHLFERIRQQCSYISKVSVWETPKNVAVYEIS